MPAHFRRCARKHPRRPLNRRGINYFTRSIYFFRPQELFSVVRVQQSSMFLYLWKCVRDFPLIDKHVKAPKDSIQGHMSGLWGVNSRVVIPTVNRRLERVEPAVFARRYRLLVLNLGSHKKQDLFTQAKPKTLG